MERKCWARWDSKATQALHYGGKGVLYVPKDRG